MFSCQMAGGVGCTPTSLSAPRMEIVPCDETPLAGAVSRGGPWTGLGGSRFQPRLFEHSWPRHSLPRDSRPACVPRLWTSAVVARGSRDGSIGERRVSSRGRSVASEAPGLLRPGAVRLRPGPFGSEGRRTALNIKDPLRPDGVLRDP